MGTRRTTYDREARAAADRRRLQRVAPRTAEQWIEPRTRHCWVRREGDFGSAGDAEVAGLVLGWCRRHDQHGQERWFARVVVAGDQLEPDVLELPASAVRPGR